ncbi:MAG: hypothetical protein ACOX3W_00425 [Christensenellaceae bacterium]|jgi:hypothetical protein
MQKLTIQFDQPQIEINGEVFNLLLSDAEIVTLIMQTLNEYEAFDVESSTTEERLEMCMKANKVIEKIIGKGAVKRMSGGKPVGMVKMLEVLRVILDAANQSYAGYIAEEYE